MYPIALDSGIRSDQYWNMTFQEIMYQILAYRKHERDQLTQRAYMDHRLAELIAYAFNDPQKMPKALDAYPFLKETQQGQAEIESQERQRMTNDQMLLMQQANLIKETRKRKQAKEKE